SARCARRRCRAPESAASPTAGPPRRSGRSFPPGRNRAARSIRRPPGRSRSYSSAASRESRRGPRSAPAQCRPAPPDASRGSPSAPPAGPSPGNPCCAASRHIPRRGFRGPRSVASDRPSRPRPPEPPLLLFLLALGLLGLFGLRAFCRFLALFRFLLALLDDFWLGRRSLGCRCHRFRSRLLFLLEHHDVRQHTLLVREQFDLRRVKRQVARAELLADGQFADVHLEL